MSKYREFKKAVPVQITTPDFVEPFELKGTCGSITFSIYVQDFGPDHPGCLSMGLRVDIDRLFSPLSFVGYGIDDYDNSTVLEVCTEYKQNGFISTRYAMYGDINDDDCIVDVTPEYVQDFIVEDIIRILFEEPMLLPPEAKGPAVKLNFTDTHKVTYKKEFKCAIAELIDALPEWAYKSVQDVRKNPNITSLTGPKR